jgi:release factor glutamine methyltransferase
MAGASSDWTIGKLIEWTRGFFDKKGIPQPRLEAEILLAYVLTMERINLYMKYDQPVTDDQRTQFRELVRRRSEHEPTRYLIGTSEFMSLAMKVTRDCLIPRPETEMLVEELLRRSGARRRPPGAVAQAAAAPPALSVGGVKIVSAASLLAGSSGAGAAAEAAPAGASDSAGQAGAGQPVAGQTAAAPASAPAAAAPATIIELCTGCGCVAVSAATYLPGSRVTASDISHGALDVARENAEAHGVADRLTLLEGDLFAPLDAADVQPADFLLANPPYVAERDWDGLAPEIREHEPRAALVAGPSGTEFIERIVKGAPAYLKLGGTLLMEIGHDQGVAAAARATAVRGLAEVEVLKDYAGLDRILVARRADVR